MAETPVEQIPAVLVVPTRERAAVAEDQRLYWQRRFDQQFPMLELPIDRPRMAMTSIVWAQHALEIPHDLVVALQTVPQRAGASLSTTLLAAFQALLARYSGQSDIVVGAPAGSGTLMIWTDVSGNPPFRTLLGRAHRSLTVARASQELPPEHIASGADGAPPFQVMFDFQHDSGSDEPSAAVRSSGRELGLWLRQDGLGLAGALVYNRGLFDAATIERMSEHFQTLLAGIAASPDQRLRTLPLLAAHERQQVLATWNDSQAWYPRDSAVHQLFEAQAARHPTRVAVVFEDQRITYADLNRRANQLADYLRSLGVGPDVLVGLCMERSIEVIVGILGILKAGGAYVPLDPAYPQERLSFMLEDAQVPVLLTQQRIVGGLPESQARVVRLDADWEAIGRCSAANPERCVLGEQRAYVIYTSGSTGRPKGVMVKNRPLINLCYGLQQFFDDDRVQEVALITSISFDISVNQIFPTLLFGKTLHVISDDVKYDSQALVDYIERRHIHLIDCVPSYLNLVLTSAHIDYIRNELRYMLVGGEKIERSLLQRVFRQLGEEVVVVNIYGLTEITDINVLTPITSGDLDAPITIGVPLINTKAYIVNRDYEPQPIGITGELCISGEGLSRGYLNRPELTAEKFVVSPFGRGEVMCRTGDVGRWLPNGTIELFGRIDHQVKINGFRIETGEIEVLLAQHPAVREAVVVAWKDAAGTQRLVAYVMPTNDYRPTTNDQRPPTNDQRQGDTETRRHEDKTEQSPISNLQSPISESNGQLVRELRSFLQARLPEYMVPSSFVMLDVLPHTPNGKIDRRALPAPGLARAEADGGYAAPRTPTERTLAEIWAGVLGVDQIGIHDHFFELGGHSLAAIQVLSRIREAFLKTLSLRRLFEAPTVAGLAQLLDAAPAGGNAPAQADVPRSLAALSMQPPPRGGRLPLSFSQERVWFLQRLDPSSMSYNFQATLRLRGALDVPVLEQSLSEIVGRHEIYRTTFPEVDGQPEQQIHAAWAVGLDVIDLHDTPGAEREAAVQRYLAAELRKPFDMGQLPLIRWLLLRLSQDEHILVHVEHHLVHDGWSFNVFLRELIELYRAYCGRAQPALAELPIQFADYALWQRQWMQGAMAEQQIDYWRRRLAGAQALLELPTDHPRPAVQRFRGAAPRIELPVPLCQALRGLSRRAGVTLFMTLFSAFLVLLERYAGRTDLSVGSGVANRHWRETEGLIGMLVDMLVLRTDLSGNPTFRELLGRVREVTLEAYAHQDVPFDKVVEALQPARDLSYNPLFQVSLSFHDAPLPDLELPGLAVEVLEGISNGSAKFDMNIIAIPRSEQRRGQQRKAGAEGITLIWEYNTDLFAAATIQRMVAHFQTLLEGIVADPERRLADLPLVTQVERHRLLVEWNDTYTEYPRHACIHRLVEAQAACTPSAAAVVGGDESWSYATLNQRANQLAHYLRAHGVGPDVPVALFLDRSPVFVVAMLAALKAGGAYVPLDLAYPPERLAYMLTDSGAPLVVTSTSLAAGLPSHAAGAICLDAEQGRIAQEPTTNLPAGGETSANLAYIIYTSGSTGKPKGTGVPHYAITRLALNTNYIDLGPDDRVSHISNTSFDAATFEVWGALLSGARLVIIPPAVALVPEVLTQYVRDQGVTVLFLPTALFNLLAATAPQALQGIPQVLTGGEAADPKWMRSVLANGAPGRLLNLYGPTESTTFATWQAVTDVPEGAATVPIGRPVTNSEAYVLDEALNLVPTGVVGELYLGGDGLARGYWRRPELTAERFIPNPFSRIEDGRSRMEDRDLPSSILHPPSSTRLYRTGDLARWQADGTLECMGRLDQQVKIRGFRIELGEIEALLSTHPSIQDAVVLAREDVPGEKRLVAYLVPKIEDGGWKIEDRQPATSEMPSSILHPPSSILQELRAFLKTKLPEYMVPSGFVLLDALPLTPNGKVDRRALPRPDATPALETEFVAPRNPVEQTIADIWRRVLGVSQVGIHDSFFALGGHSLLATQIIARVRDDLQVSLPLQSLFETPTVAGLADAVIQTEFAQADSTLLDELLADLGSLSPDAR